MSGRPGLVFVDPESNSEERQEIRRRGPTPAFKSQTNLEPGVQDHRIFSGIQPTGAIHIGNYAGAIRTGPDAGRGRVPASR